MLLTIGILMLRDLISARANSGAPVITTDTKARHSVRWNNPGILIGFPLCFPDRLHQPMERPHFFKGLTRDWPDGCGPAPIMTSCRFLRWLVWIGRD
jgi:hypothetical protein